VNSSSREGIKIVAKSGAVCAVSALVAVASCLIFHVDGADGFNIGIGTLGIFVGFWGLREAFRAQAGATTDRLAAAEENRETRAYLTGLKLSLASSTDALAKLERLTASIGDSEETARKELAELRSLTAEITPAIQTRTIGAFPANIPLIVDLIGKAKSSIVIATDVAFYGHYSSPAWSEGYHAALAKAAAGGVAVRVICYSGDRARAERRRQFSMLANESDGLAETIKDERWRAFSARHALKPVSTIDDFILSLEYADRKFKSSISSFVGVEIHELPQLAQSLPVFFWLCDNDEAIFSLFTVGERSREISIRTKDRSILDKLRTTYDSLVATEALRFDSRDSADKYSHLLDESRSR
jgi:hypothetical protein